jgi:hypothetical protein
MWLVFMITAPVQAFMERAHALVEMQASRSGVPVERAHDIANGRERHC